LSLWEKILGYLRQLVDLLFPPSLVVQGGIIMPRITVAVVNASSVLTDKQITPVIQALQVQVSTHFAPVWGTDAQLIQVLQGQKVPAGAWQLVILDDSDTAGALGYHDLTSEGYPIGKVFAGTDMKYGNLWSVTASHELLEMLGDADINLTVQVDDTTFIAYENCDACEDDSLGYFILLKNGPKVKVSDFVTPAWFMANPPAGAKLDFAGHISQPFQLLPGGYIGVWTPQGGWTQKTAEGDTKAIKGSRAHVGSRRERRRTPRHQWLLSADPAAQG